MKPLVTLLLLLALAGSSIAQPGSQIPAKPTQDIAGLLNATFGKFRKALMIPDDTLAYGSDSLGMLGYKNNIVYIRVLVAGVRKFIPVGSGLGALSYGGPITTWPGTGFNPNTTDVAAWITNTFYGTQPPTATLAGGTTVELMAPGANLTYTLSWGAARQAATAPISTIMVGGAAQVFGQPAQGGSVSGTKSVSVVRNTNTTFQNVVTTTDGKTAAASITVAFSPSRYFGWVTSTSPGDAAVIAAGSELSASNAKTWTQGAPGGSKYLVYAYPANEGALTHFDINGFPSIGAMQLTTRSFTNASGNTQSYNIYVSFNAFTVTGTTSIVAY